MKTPNSLSVILLHGLKKMLPTERGVYKNWNEALAAANLANETLITVDTINTFN
jgi:hypothetical protein